MTYSDNTTVPASGVVNGGGSVRSVGSAGSTLNPVRSTYRSDATGEPEEQVGSLKIFIVLNSFDRARIFKEKMMTRSDEFIIKLLIAVVFHFSVEGE